MRIGSGGGVGGQEDVRVVGIVGVREEQRRETVRTDRAVTDRVRCLVRHLDAGPQGMTDKSCIEPRRRVELIVEQGLDRGADELIARDRHRPKRREGRKQHQRPAPAARQSAGQGIVLRFCNIELSGIMTVAQLISYCQRVVNVMLDFDRGHVNIGTQVVSVLKAVIIALSQRQWRGCAIPDGAPVGPEYNHGRP